MIDNSPIEMAKSLAIKTINDFPNIKNEVIDSFNFMLDEIEDSTSEELEIERFIEFINDIKG